MQVASCLWDRERGTVELGQWLKARIYEHRSDLSPDGRHMIIYARRGGKSWTAVSRAPWLKALAYYPKNDTWFGGGAFTDEGDVFFNGMSVSEQFIDGLAVAAPDALPSATDGFHMGALFPSMMAARGWRIDGGTGKDTRFSKLLPCGCTLHLRLERGYRSAGTILDHVFTLERADQTTDQTIDCGEWEWAEPWDNGIQFARAGALWFVPVTKAGLGEPRIVHDFTDMVFENREAPYEGIQE
ncbi:hypothetical protein A8B78_03535 [Jannaschia sp. EhC01]|nr:hypothetical protein A8B78_03535 [Jannaschia sp. EhC01]